ncbi:MAG: hypothetical protein HY560_07680 [Gemmatimonadetes bacterium]|nr:hypothetical protein [Gemmatimonadota bacterium]
MALVRCPKHKIPYNDENPRGCPACAREKEGGDVSNVMQELARASQQGIRRPSGLVAPPPPPEAPVTKRPRLPVAVATRFNQAIQLLKQRRNLSIAGAIIAVLLVVIALSGGSRFVSAPSPVYYTGDVRPLPIMPNDPIAIVLSALGPQSSQPNPSSRTLERYSYGTDLYVDALNSAVYAITLAVPNRAWRGLRVGMTQTMAEGTLALLGVPREVETLAETADTISGFVVHRSLDARPRRTLRAEVRPPNGCFDVLVDLQPRAIGTLTRGSRKWAVVARIGGPIDWVVTRIRVVSRSVSGPYAGEPVC